MLTSWRGRRASEGSRVADHTAVHEQGAARYVGGVVRGEEEGQVRYFLRLAHAAEGNLREKFFHLVGVFFERGVHGGFDGARGDVVYSDVVGASSTARVRISILTPPLVAQ
jgi:hypothetical protein